MTCEMAGKKDTWRNLVLQKEENIEEETAGKDYTVKTTIGFT